MQRFCERERPDDDPMKRCHMWGTPTRAVDFVNRTGEDIVLFVYPRNSGWQVDQLRVQLQAGLSLVRARVELDARMRQDQHNEWYCGIDVPSGMCGPVNIAKQEVQWSVAKGNVMIIHRQALNTRKKGAVVLNY